MAKSPVIHDTFIIERHYPAPVERVFGYLADPAKKRRWYAESDHSTTERFEMDFREGGVEGSSYRMGPGTPVAGMVFANDGVFQDIVPNSRVVIATSMTMDGRRISSSLITFELFAADGGTEMVLTHQGVFFEGADGPQMRAGGWRALMDRLGRTLAAA